MTADKANELIEMFGDTSKITPETKLAVWLWLKDIVTSAVAEERDATSNLLKDEAERMGFMDHTGLTRLALVRAMVAWEQERCAKVAWDRECLCSPNVLCNCKIVAGEIAAAIRKGG